MPCIIRKWVGDKCENHLTLADDEWKLREQVDALEAWLSTNPGALDPSIEWFADIGFCLRADAMGGGPVISRELMEMCLRANLDIYLSEYPGNANRTGPADGSLGAGRTQLRPKVGLGGATFGMTEDQVRAIFGWPDSVNEGAMGDIWWYDARGITFCFSGVPHQRLDAIDVKAGTPLLDGEPVLDAPVDRLTDLLALAGVESVTTDEGHVAVEEWATEFCIKDGRVHEVRCEVPLDDDLNEVWPSPSGT